MFSIEFVAATELVFLTRTDWLGTTVILLVRVGREATFVVGDERTVLLTGLAEEVESVGRLEPVVTILGLTCAFAAIADKTKSAKIDHRFRVLLFKIINKTP